MCGLGIANYLVVPKTPIGKLIKDQLVKHLSSFTMGKDMWTNMESIVGTVFIVHISTNLPSARPPREGSSCVRLPFCLIGSLELNLRFRASSMTQS